jgi:hypothetical protein
MASLENNFIPAYEYIMCNKISSKATNSLVHRDELEQYAVCVALLYICLN